MSTRETTLSLPAESETPTIVIEPRRGLAALKLGDVWAYRELLYFLVWRDVKVRYKQTVLGVLWVVLQPLASMAIFTVLFGILLKVPSGDAPYPVFAYAGLLPWGYFSAALSRSSGSVVGSAHLISKVYFPRLIVPLAGVMAGLVDFAISFVMLLIVMLCFGLTPTVGIVLVPVFVLLAMITALGFGLWLSALHVRYRDIGYLVPFLVQIWMYLTPVVYGSSIVPERYRFLLSLNPMTGVVEGFRWALLGQSFGDGQFSLPLFAISVAISLGVLVSGAFYFRTTERDFADVI